MKKNTVRYSSGLLIALTCASVSAQTADDTLLDMDLARLGEITLAPSATMTPTTARRQPASVTVIDRSMIRDSAARSLFDLLETYVPNFHYLPHHWEAPHMGMRAIIGDRDDKYLIVLNGRVLNELTHYGAMSERDLPMLDDIHHIDVVRGPGSVIYGPGAVSMVINIQTESATDNSGDAATLKLGAVEQFESLEFKKSLSFGARHGLLLYAGMAAYQGADQSDAPMVYGNTFQTTWGQTVHAGEPTPFEVPDNHAAFRGKPRMKFHADYELDDFRAWLRYTQGGEELTWEHKIFGLPPVGFGAPGSPQASFPIQGVGYRQLVLDLSNRWALGRDLSLELKGGYDSFTYERTITRIAPPWTPSENHREDHYTLRGTLRGKAGDTQAFAAGAEYVYSRYGLPSPGYGDVPPYSAAIGPNTPQWSTSAFGLFGEHQWQATDTLTNFLGLRVDKDEYTQAMWSPRWSVVYAPNERDTFKSVLSRSVRKNNAEELFKQHRAGQTSEPEILQGIELIYQRTLTPALRLDVSMFYNQVQVIGINTASLRSTRIADFNYTGAEFELSYKTAAWRLSASHASTRLLEFNAEPGVVTRLSAAYLGYGNDLNNWSNQITKIAATWQYAPQWRLSGALRVFWGYPGAQAVTQAINDAFHPGSPSTSSLSDPGYTDSFQEAVFLDFGAQYQMTQRDTFSFNAYNALGWVDHRYNKRLYLLNGTNYRAEAPAIAVGYRHEF
ncbi:hypothetical protein GCM10025771_15260 [Niveibacterium umoris]|uniref:Iron complex outermembrane receptor protein n=1 Tax=Niveibacterium umoris TaxID=1193620 RepID=A0A840BT64_9RHOO|nr:TonB-dependent receptor [Niveibacterium umoris]MBB4014599.1 iron complex outermembrane receptor protein [Niveibacterium umoris]